MLSQLPVLVLVFVDPICTSESCRATGTPLFYLQAEILRKSIFYFVCLLALVHLLLLQTANVPPIVSCFPLLSFKLKARVKVEDAVVVFKCQHLCVLCVGGGCLKEEVLSGTEAFCRCCKGGGLNGNFCGYQLCRCTLCDLKRYVT